MPIIVNEGQQVRAGAVYPISVYSRVVSVDLAVAQAWGWTYVVTPVMGNRVWLLGIKVWPQVMAINAAQGIDFELFDGGPGDVSLADVQTWDRLLPKVNNTNVMVPWAITDGSAGFEWDLSRLFVGESRRFALVGTRTGPDAALLQVSFRIAEG